MNKQLIIALEGPNGSGKTTLAKLLVNYYKENGEKAKYIHEPYGVMGKAINIIKDYLIPKQLVNLYSIAQTNFLNNMSQMDCDLFIVDRWSPSTIIYNQIFYRNYSCIKTNCMQKKCDGIVLLNTPFVICKQRLLERNRKDNTYILENLKRIYKLYEKHGYKLCSKYSIEKPVQINTYQKNDAVIGKVVNYVHKIRMKGK